MSFDEQSLWLSIVKMLVVTLLYKIDRLDVCVKIKIVEIKRKIALWEATLVFLIKTEKSTSLRTRTFVL